MACAFPSVSPAALDNPEYYHMASECSTVAGAAPATAAAARLPTPPPKPPRLAASDPAAAGSFSRGEYLYTRLERPAAVTPPPRPVETAAAGGGVMSSPYDNVPMTRRGGRPPATAVAVAESPPPQQAAPTPPSILTEEQLRHQQDAERAELSWHQLEQSRLDDILTACAEYDSQMSAQPPPPPPPPPPPQQQQQQPAPQPAPRPPGSPAPFHSRIKTNGSLPRDRRLGSPGAVTPPEGCRRAAPAASVSAASDDSDDELSATGELSSSLRSPYENVSALAYPQSPRTRIRTTLQRDQRQAAAAREASPPQQAAAAAAGAVYMVPPPPVPLPAPRAAAATANGGERDQQQRHSLQFDNREYMHGLPLDPTFHHDDLVFLPAVGGGYVNTGMDEETRLAAAAAAAAAAVAAAAADWPPDADPPPTDQLTRLRRSLSDATDDDREICRRLKDQRRMTYRQLSELRQHKLDLEHQESESIRQLEVEHALLESEVGSGAERLQRLADEVQQRQQALAERGDTWEETRRRRTAEADELAGRIVAAEAELERLEALSDQFRGSTDEETRLLEKLKYQHELVEQERKAHEDQEFHHMEDQVAWEAEREESLRVIGHLEARIARTRGEMDSVRAQQRALIESIRRDTETMEQQRREIVKQMCQERDKLRKTQRRLSNLSQSGVDEADDDPELQEPELSSDPEEFTNNEYIESRLAQLHMLGKSRDDLQRIQSVTASSPMQVDNRSSNTLREIERNRHVLLAKQGTQVIEEERRRVEELKRRVQDEVTAQWQQRRRRRSGGGDSLDSSGSSEEAERPTSPDGAAGRPAAETAARVTNGNSHDAEQRTDPADAAAPDRAASTNGASTGTAAEECAAAQEQEQENEEARPRPISDASSVFDGVEEPVRRRDRLAMAPRQRPLTRYMPITDDQFDLRRHIETAGHQLEMCRQLTVTRHACRGFLHKLSGRFRSWQRRWFVFDRSRARRTFMYYADKTETRAKGGVYFQAIEEVYVDHVKNRGGAANTTFCVKTMSRTFVLMAPSPETMRIWVDVIMTGAEGHTVFDDV